MRSGVVQPEVLLVTAKHDPRVWIFPKGHVEMGELQEHAALRELHEEAGVRGKLVQSIGSASFRSGKEDVHVQYFLVRAINQGQAAEGRRLVWLPANEARAELSFLESKELLDKALTVWNRLEPGS